MGDMLEDWVGAVVSPFFRREGIELVLNYYDRVSGGLSLESIAQDVVERVSQGDASAIFTGFRVPPDNIQETDGPAGAVFLSYCLKQVGSKPHIFIEGSSKEVLRPLLEVLGLDNIVSIHPLPEGKSMKNRLTTIAELMDVNPSIMVFVEKPGPNYLGVYHSMRGLDVTRTHVDVIPALTYAEENDVLTLGIGDGGNEVGMGCVEGAIRKHVPYGNICNCPCRGGIASSTRTDHLIISPTSNWGAYILSAAIYRLTGVKECLINEAVEETLIKTSLKAGAVDGVTGGKSLSVDSYDITALKGFIKVLREKVKEL
jgi:hypothetical protein